MKIFNFFKKASIFQLIFSILIAILSNSHELYMYIYVSISICIFIVMCMVWAYIELNKIIELMEKPYDHE